MTIRQTPALPLTIGAAFAAGIGMSYWLGSGEPFGARDDIRGAWKMGMQGYVVALWLCAAGFLGYGLWQWWRERISRRRPPANARHPAPRP